MAEWHTILDQLEIPDGAVAGLNASHSPVLRVSHVYTGSCVTNCTHTVVASWPTQSPRSHACLCCGLADKSV